MKKIVNVAVDIPVKIYYIDYIYDYVDCERVIRCIYENKFFYDKDTAINYAKFKNLPYEKYDIEELELGAIKKEDIN